MKEIKKVGGDALYFWGERVNFIAPFELLHLLELKAKHPSTPLIVCNTTIGALILTLVFNNNNAYNFNCANRSMYFLWVDWILWVLILIYHYYVFDHAPERCPSCPGGLPWKDFWAQSRDMGREWLVKPTEHWNPFLLGLLKHHFLLLALSK